ncbi:vWA domain-containing protein [Saliphagus infecundisoli]|uniref:VWA domain-containing protein n=1 Tax=Saliphagus infecundisoli TaxID=1849069 RepID=A0ABD5QGR6_9EURY|nr:VWA domain-containing protein [Saliphagus infecundisoli]
MFENEEGTDLEAARERTLGALVSFSRALRREGVSVPADGSLVAARALATVGLSDRERVRAALKAALVAGPDEEDVFERLFPSFWRQFAGEGDFWTPPAQDGPDAGEPAPVEAAPESGGGEDTNGSDAGRDGGTVARRGGSTSETESADPVSDGTSAAVYSPVGSTERVDAIGREDATLERSIDRLGRALARLRGRQVTQSGDERPDVRRALRRAGGGVPLPLPTAGRDERAVRALVLADVSRSVLDTVDRPFLLAALGHMTREWREVRTFLFDTDVREVTRAIGSRDAGTALERAEAEWGGGTRIGEAIAAIRRAHPGAVDRDTVVLVASDGLEVGDVAELEEGMAWLSGASAGVLWLNPLAGSPEYEPTCRGMAAALPYVDGLFAFAGPGDVREVARQLERQGLSGSIGYEYDPRP